MIVARKRNVGRTRTTIGIVLAALLSGVPLSGADARVTAPGPKLEMLTREFEFTEGATYEDDSWNE